LRTLVIGLLLPGNAIREWNRIVDDLRNVSAVCVRTVATNSNYDALRAAIAADERTTTEALREGRTA